MTGGNEQQFRVALTLHGTTDFTVATTQFEQAADEISVIGTMVVDQRGFGIVPFSILGGAIAVQDRVHITYRIRARRID